MINNTDQCYFSWSDQTLSCTCFADFFSIVYFCRNSLHFWRANTFLDFLIKIHFHAFCRRSSKTFLRLINSNLTSGKETVIKSEIVHVHLPLKLSICFQMQSLQMTLCCTFCSISHWWWWNGSYGYLSSQEFWCQPD